MGKEKAVKLLRRYLKGAATPEEQALLESWYFETARAQPVMSGEPDYSKMEEDILGLLRVQQQFRRKVINFSRHIAAAAAVLIILSLGSFFIARRIPASRIARPRPPGNDILPAVTRAHLTLPDGRMINLDSAHSGPLARQDDAIISSLGGQLIYGASQADRSAEQGPTAYHTLTTLPGEHFSLLLADGTKAWLNAASSITFPAVFNGSERKVRVTGEVYFEIVHNPKQPFSITVRNELIEDIGTRLNINAYDDESTINTTLLEGAIKISSRSVSAAVLEPGQQAMIRPGENAFELRHVDAGEAIAWKNGYFYFDRADIRTVMRQLARWYNVQLVYKGKIPKKTLKGKICRNINASEALEILSYFGAHFQVDGKTITLTF